MLKRLLKIALCIAVFILVLGPVAGYWLRRTLNSSDLRTRYNFVHKFHILTFSSEPNAPLVQTVFGTRSEVGKALFHVSNACAKKRWNLTWKW